MSIVGLAEADGCAFESGRFALWNPRPTIPKRTQSYNAALTQSDPVHCHTAYGP
jgi:hypothetical protein